MNPIVTQSGQVSYSPWPLLAAPRIAGLLPARVGADPPLNPPPEFTYRNPTLNNLSAERRSQIVDAVTTLLDVAVAYAHDEMNDNALRAAQVLFHRQLTGHSPDRTGRHAVPPLHPIAYRAERDADLLDWLVSVRKRMAPLSGFGERAGGEVRP